MFHDVDILVPRDRLPQVEAALMLHGWATTHHDAYDQRYYREWMHELPPMRHVTRGTIVDVHHAILPLTARLRFDGTKLLQAARPASGDRRFMVLAPADMVLHSAVHFVYNEELAQGLRDLADIDALLAHFGAAEPFWRELAERADELGLQRPLFYALRYATRFFGSRVPPAVAAGFRRGVPSRGLRAWMDTLFMRALRAGHPYADDALAPAARLLLYVRAHWLRMPPLLLVRHLTTKALRREPDDRARAPV
jgi:hypothetical protein